MIELRNAIDTGTLGGRLWLYSNYHCNLRCSYCLTESSPSSPKQLFDADHMVAAAREARDLGFRSIGITGGEPFVRPDMPEIIAAIASHLPVLVLTNGTLFTSKLLARLAPATQHEVTFQLSLDAADAETNDASRAAGNHASVVSALSALIARGARVRIATTGDPDDEARARLCAMHLALGISEDDHVIRPTVRRGRAVANDDAVPASNENLSPELTLTAEGAYWSPFAPTVRAGRTDTDLLICRITSPLRASIEQILRVLDGRVPMDAAASGIP